MTQKILIVDDEPNISAPIQEVLQMGGHYLVDRAFDGQQGMEKYRTFLPDLVLMDVNMPVMDGYHSSKEIKTFDPEARILVFTGNAWDSRALRIMEEGLGLSVLQKPLRLRELMQIIRDNLPRPV
jgi:two-component system chemotaxis response regulator CheY